MKKAILFLMLLAGATLCAHIAEAQNGNLITTVAGNGSGVFFGDGGPATAAGLYSPNGVAVDGVGNIYIASGCVVRKVSTSGIINTIAGNDSLGGGYSGDGGAATVAQLRTPWGIALDGAGNIYISDETADVIRKVNPLGIISTIAGGGTSYGIDGYGDGGPATGAKIGGAAGVALDKLGNIYIADYGYGLIRKVNALGVISVVAGSTALGTGFSGDGGPATDAQITGPSGVVVDGAGNIYIPDLANYVVRKVDAFGTITTFAGNHLLGAGYSGDGGAATAARLGGPFGAGTDAAGNIYITDDYDNVIRKVNTAGIISTVAGNAAPGFSGDGGVALAAEFNQPVAVATDVFGSVYIADASNNRIRKVAGTPTIADDSLSVYINQLCSGPELTIATHTYSSMFSVKTIFGDGTNDSSTFLPSGSSGVTSFYHTYQSSGTYTIKEILYNGTVPVDSLHYTYNYSFCANLPVLFYYDASGNCIKDSTDPFISLPIVTEVDSNGGAVDTISCTSGFYYTAYGVPGDVYTFKPIILPIGLTASCPVSDTLQSLVYNNTINYFGFSCNSTAGYDLSVNAAMTCGHHLAAGVITVNNASCNAENATLTMNIDPKYIYYDGYPVPSSIIGNTLTWNMSELASVVTGPVYIQFTLTKSGADLNIGDTVQTNFVVTPFAGDIDTLNNTEILIDTVRGGFDPNEMSVSPGGNIYAGTQLQYVIQFENTGNDTAFNIYILDTLSDNVDVNSLRLVAASARMNIEMLKGWGHNVVKFDFPGINLLDSSHHNQCNGMVIFNINTKAGLPFGTTIFNHAGVYFDDNPVVMTDTVENVIGFPTAVNNIPPAAGSVHIYPNPTNDVLTIKTDNASYNSFTITNSVGEVAAQQQINGTQTNINVKSLPAGVYFITLKGESGVIVKKIVKQ